jgi:alanine dehydrogenase
VISISESQVLALVSPAEAYEAVKAAHLALASGAARNVVRSRARAERMSLHTMSAVDLDGGYAAAKIYSAAPAMAASHVLLYRTDDGALLAMIEANELGRLRTAAAALLATELFVPDEISTLGMFGTGFQAEGFLRALAQKQTFVARSCLIFGRNEEKAKAFAERCSKFGINCRHAKAALEAAVDSEVIVTATTAAAPLFRAADLKRCVHITTLGSNSLARHEIGADVAGRAAFVAVDDKEVAKAEGGNLIDAIETGKLAWNEVHELGELLNDTPEVTRDERTPWSLYCSHGAAVQDLYLAKALYEKIN